MTYDLDSITSDCYEGTTCLVNKFDIMDEKILSRIETDITFAKSAELEQNPIEGNFDTKHYKAIHKYLFEDLYDWAGTFRTINMSKKGTSFIDHEKLDETCERCFSRLRSNNYLKGLDYDSFVEEIVDLYCLLNIIHPFREGNGRVERIFITQLIRHNGYELNFSEIDTDLLMIATIQAAHGVNNNLKMIIKDSMKHQ